MIQSVSKNPSSSPLVSARGLTKTFNGRTAVDGISFDIFPGEIIGFLGPNGAGKTTTIRMLLNLINPSAGELSLFGHTYETSRSEILKQMNASSGTLTLPGKLSVMENLIVFGDLYGISKIKQRIGELMEKFELTDFQNKPLYSLSTGQQVRVSLAKAFLNRPKLLLLDEPTASLDPDVADRVRSFLINVVKYEGTTVFLTSHNMSEVEKVCSRVLFLSEGKIQAEGSPKELARRLKRWKLFIKVKKPIKQLPPNLSELKITLNDRDLIVELDQMQVGSFITDLVKHGIEIDSLSTHEPTLEDFFVYTARKPDGKN